MLTYRLVDVIYNNLEIIVQNMKIKIIEFTSIRIFSKGTIWFEKYLYLRYSKVAFLLAP